MKPLLARLHSVVQEIFERNHDDLRMSAIAATTALYQLAAKCWPEMGYDRGDAEDNPVALFEAHEILTTAWQGEIHRAIIHVAEESSQEDAAFLYFMLGFLAAGYRDHLKYGRTPQWVEDFLRAEEEEDKKLQWNEYAVEGTSPAWLSIGQRVTVAFVELADDNYEIDDASHPNALLRLRDFETGEVRESGVYTYEEARHLADLHGQKCLDLEQSINRGRKI